MTESHLGASKKFKQTKMEELLVQALRGSFSPDQSQRDEAEAFLTKTEQSAGYVQALVRLWVNQSVCYS